MRFTAKKIKRRLLRAIGPRLDRLWCTSVEPFEPTPVWIIGPPRSGSTLIYNTLVNSFKFTYISNFVAKFPELTLPAFYMEQFLSFKKNYSYQFDEGDTRKLAAPHEAWNFLYRWFPRGYQNVYLTADDISEQNRAAFRCVLQALIAMGEAPFILKNTFNSMRISALNYIFPESIFIVCQRKERDVAQSIFKARMATADPGKWWSAAPKEYEQIKLMPIHEQIARQVAYIYRQIDQDRAQLALGDRMMDVSYRDFCEDPPAVLNKISHFLQANGLEAHQIQPFPAPFDYRSGQKINDDDYKKLQQILCQLHQA